MPEFTGERIIPGQVEADLWNEHAARYWFAGQYASGKRILDAGCGTGYGSDRLAAVAATVAAMDVAPEAFAYARDNYRRPNLNFVQGSCSALPFASASFDLIVNFEVIEHIEDWRACLREFRRVLAPSGALIISTPNTTYYAEARRESGPNPFHVHEFEYAEFEEALGGLFPHVEILTQNHTDGIVFLPPAPPADASIGIERATADPTSANFFLAVCRLQPGPAARPFVFLPTAANLLQERETHIRLLAADLERLRIEKQNLVEMFRCQEAELEKSNRWAEDLDAALKEAGARVTALQGELAAEQASAAEHVARLESELAAQQASAAEHVARLENALATEQASAKEHVARLQDELTAEQAAAARHIARLERDLAAAQESATAQITRLQEQIAAEQASATAHIARLEGELAVAHRSAASEIGRLESEKLAAANAYEAEIAQLTASLASSSQGYEAQIARDQEEKAAELAHCVSLLDKAEATVVERTEWALRLQEENRQLLAVLEKVKASRWVKLAGALGASPVPPER